MPYPLPPWVNPEDFQRWMQGQGAPEEMAFPPDQLPGYGANEPAPSPPVEAPMEFAPDVVSGPGSAPPPPTSTSRSFGFNYEPPVSRATIDSYVKGGPADQVPAETDRIRQQIAAPYDAANRTAAEAASARSRVNEAMAGAQAASARTLHDQAVSDMEAETRIRAQAAVDRDGYLKAVDASRARARQTVDSTKLWSSATRGQQFGGMLGMILSGLVSPKFGGKNGAMEIIQQAMERNVDEQIANIKNAQEDVRLGMESYRLLVNKQDLDGLGRKELRLLATDAAMKDLESKLTEIGASDEATMAAATETMAAFQKMIADQERDFYQTATQFAQKGADLQLEARRDAANAAHQRASIKEQQADRQERIDARTQKAQEVAAPIPIRTGEKGGPDRKPTSFGNLRQDVAGTPALANNVQAAFRDFGTGMDQVTDLIKLMDQYGGSSDLRDKVALSKTQPFRRVERAAQAVTAAVAKANNPDGKISDSDIEVAARQAGTDFAYNLFGSTDAKELVRDLGKQLLDAGQRNATSYLDEDLVEYKDKYGQTKTRTRMEDTVERRLQSWGPKAVPTVEGQIKKARTVGGPEQFQRPVEGGPPVDNRPNPEHADQRLEELVPVARDIYYGALKALNQGNEDEFKRRRDVLAGMDQYVVGKAFSDAKAGDKSAPPAGASPVQWLDVLSKDRQDRQNREYGGAAAGF